MLYDEFLNGTKKPDNLHTYSEYKRIEQIYLNDDEMTKEQAYALYKEPSKLVKQLMKELEESREQTRIIANELIQAKKENEELKKGLESKKAVINSLNFTNTEILKEIDIVRNRVSNLIYG